MDPSLPYCEPYATVICCQASVRLATPKSQCESVAINIAREKNTSQLKIIVKDCLKEVYQSNTYSSVLTLPALTLLKL